MKLRGKQILVLGLGESGLASACWCLRQGARLRIADTRAAPPYLDELRRRGAGAEFGFEFIPGEFAPTLLEGIDLLVLSPGLAASLPVVVQARAAGIAVVGEIELFAWGLRDLGAVPPVLAITGTNGKTTTTALTGHLLQATGKRVGVAGNISPAALTALMDALDAQSLPQIWVLELSSFQLETTRTLHAAAATVLNVSDDHLDRYAGIEDYAAAKARIFAGDGVQVLNRDDARVAAMALPGRRMIRFGLEAPAAGDDFGIGMARGEPWIAQGDRMLLPLSELPLAGLHNAANAMAALALCGAIGTDVESLLPALRSFRGLPHRVEKIAEIDGVSWYDDSKGTNVGATVAALSGLSGGVGRKSVVILGGDGKNQDFCPLRDAVANHARAVILIGRDAPLIGEAIAAAGVATESATDMDDAVRRAATLARPGDAALLSPACASFDMFRNYEHRAQAFVAAVWALKGGQ